MAGSGIVSSAAGFARPHVASSPIMPAATRKCSRVVPWAVVRDSRFNDETEILIPQWAATVARAAGPQSVESRDNTHTDRRRFHPPPSRSTGRASRQNWEDGTRLTYGAAATPPCRFLLDRMRWSVKRSTNGSPVAFSSHSH